MGILLVIITLKKGPSPLAARRQIGGKRWPKSASKVLLELLHSEVAELVDAYLVAVDSDGVAGVVLVHVAEPVLKYGVAALILVDGDVGLDMSYLPLGEDLSRLLLAPTHLPWEVRVAVILPPMVDAVEAVLEPQNQAYARSSSSSWVRERWLVLSCSAFHLMKIRLVSAVILSISISLSLSDVLLLVSVAAASDTTSRSSSSDVAAMILITYVDETPRRRRKARVVVPRVEALAPFCVVDLVCCPYI